MEYSANNGHTHNILLCITLNFTLEHPPGNSFRVFQSLLLYCCAQTDSLTLFETHIYRTQQ